MSKKDTVNWKKAITVLDQYIRSVIPTEQLQDYQEAVAQGYASAVNDLLERCPVADETEQISCSDYATNCVECWLAWAVRKSTKG